MSSERGWKAEPRRRHQEPSSGMAWEDGGKVSSVVTVNREKEEEWKEGSDVKRVQGVGMRNEAV